MIVHGCRTQSADDTLRDMELVFRQMQEQRRLPSQEHKMIRWILLIRSPEKGATVTESSEIRESTSAGSIERRAIERRCSHATRIARAAGSSAGLRLFESCLASS
jgi:hypothetical protein